MNHSEAKIIQADLKTLFLREHMKPGEIYAGLVLGLNGEPDYHLFVLPGELERGTWQEAGKWAKSQGGELPNRREGRILFANAKAAFKEAWYWLSEQRAVYTDCAWLQFFGSGNQYYDLKSNHVRARAVRRIIP